MEQPHKQHHELIKELEAAKTKVTVGAIYRHYKNPDMLYKVIGLGFLESNDELHVIYQAQYGDKITFLRPLSVWLDKVNWDGQLLPRFKKT